jgi:murein DD-endopeptidase MepM/ murein hydrolase activator NlpD
MIPKIKLNCQKLAVGLFRRVSKYLTSNRCNSSTPLKRSLRRLLEKKKIKQVFGLNLLALTLVTSVVSPSISAFSAGEEEITNISNSVVQLTTERSVRWPVETVKISQGYHLLHRGVDFAEPPGSPVYPIMDGVVENIFLQRYGYGNHLIINHGSGFKSLYAHLAKITVEAGQEVDKNTVIGTIGTTGWATGPHLHLEVYDNEKPFNPLTILK